MTAPKVYIDGVEETTAYNVHVNWVMNGISSATFKIPDIHVDGTSTERDTWESRIDIAEIKIEGESSKIIFIGFIKRLDGDRILEISCESSLGKYKWYDIASGASNFKIYEGKVKTTPVNFDLYVEDAEGNVPSWAQDEYEDDYLIVSDATTSTQSKQIEWDNAGTDIVGVAQQHDIDSLESGDYTDVESATAGVGDNWEGNFANNEYARKKMVMEIDMGLAAYNQIPKTANITKIEVEVTGDFYTSCSADSMFKSSSQWVMFMMGPTVAKLANMYNIEAKFIDFSGGGLQHNYFAEKFELPVGSVWDWFFTKGASYYEGGWAGFAIRTLDDPGSSSIIIKWSSFKLKIYYDTANFDTLNQIIMGNNPTYITVQTPNLNTYGVAEGDTVLIGTPMWKAFKAIQSAASALPARLPVINHPTISRGIASDYMAISGYKFLSTLRTLNALEMYQLFDAGDTIHLQKEEDISNDGGSLTGFNALSGWESTNQKYGTITIWWSGKTEGANPIVVSTGNENPKTFTVVRKDIITASLAYETAENLAAKFANDRPSIPLSYSEWKHIIPAYLYDFTLNGDTFTDQICRRVTYAYENQKWQITAYLGGGSTPAIEAIGMAIGKLDRKITDIQSIELTGNFMPANSWSQIANKPSTFTPTAHKASHESGGSDKITVVKADITDFDSNAVAAVEAAGVAFDAAKTLKFNAGATVGEIKTTFEDNDTTLMTSQAIKEKIDTDLLNASVIHIPVAFKVTQNTGQSIPNATATKVTWNTEDYDKEANFASNKFVVPYDGVYRFDAAVLFSDISWTTGEYAKLMLYKNGAEVSLLKREECQETETILMSLVGGDSLELVVDDEIEIYIYQNSGAALALSSDAKHNYFNGFFINSSLAITSATTHYLSIPPTSFIPRTPDVSDVTIYNDQTKVDSGSAYFQCSINLPHGAVMTGVVVYGTGGVTWMLHRADRVSGLDTMCYDTMQNEVVTPNIDYATIDNENYSYSFRTYNMVAVRYVYGARITYTYNTVSIKNIGYSDAEAVAAIAADDTIYTKAEVDANTYTQSQVDSLLEDNPICVVTKSSAQNATSSSLPILWNTELVDNDSMHSTSSNTDRITIKTAGLYSITGRIELNSAASSIRQYISLYKNGAALIYADRIGMGTGYGTDMNINFYVQCAVNDYLQLKVLSTTSISMTVSRCQFSAKRIKD